MRSGWFVVPCVSALALLAGCNDRRAAADKPVQAAPAAAAAAPGAAAAAPSTEAWQAGQAIDGAEAVALGDIAARAGELGERMVRVEGTVTGVCQHRGCWIELTDGNTKLIAKSIDHSIVFPKDSVGRRMIIEGAVRVGAAPSCSGEGHGKGEGEGEAEMHAGAAPHACPQPDILVDARAARLLPKS